MSEQATIIDFLEASLQGLERSGRTILTPAEQKLADSLTIALDKELEDMVQRLEEIASCQQDMPAVEGRDEVPPFEAFCLGLKSIGEALLPHLAATFRGFCTKHKMPMLTFLWILRARSDAFVAYLLQIAQVHGLAFDENLEQVGKSEQIALARLGADLRILMQRELENFE